MRYKMNAEKIEVSIEIDDSFVETLLGMVRAAESQSDIVTPVYKPTPEQSEVRSPEVSEASEVDRTSVEYNEWVHFVLMWFMNFDQEGDQPERGENTRKLGIRRHAGRMLKMISTLGGLTHAVKDVGELAYQANESDRIAALDPDERDRLYRHVAENMAQVSSIFFSDLSDLLEYHNPLED